MPRILMFAPPPPREPLFSNTRFGEYPFRSCRFLIEEFSNSCVSAVIAIGTSCADSSCLRAVTTTSSSTALRSLAAIAGKLIALAIAPTVKPAAKPIDPMFRMLKPPFLLGRSRPSLEIARVRSFSRDDVRNLISGLIQLKPTIVDSIPLYLGKLSSKPSDTLIYVDQKSTLLSHRLSRSSCLFLKARLSEGLDRLCVLDS